MENEQILSPKESLALITDVISKTKENIREHSFIFLLWGWLMVIASLLRYAITTYTDFQQFFIPYPILSAIGILLSALFYWRKKSSVAETYLSFFIKRMWMISTLGFISVVVISVYQHLSPVPYVLVVAAIGTLLTGTTLKFRPLQIGGFLMFIAALVSATLPNDYKDLMHGSAFLLGYLTPGYLLKKANV